MARTKEKKGLKIFLVVFGAIFGLIILALIFLFALRGFANISRVDKKDILPSDNPYILENDTYISAHRAGRKLAPENTISAFSRCFSLMESKGYAVDILEFDLQLTKDGYLVLLHDDTLDRTSNCEEVEGFGKDSKVVDHTLAELQTLEMWHDYDGDDFDKAEARICTVTEVFDYVIAKGYTDMKYVVEIKDSGENGERATDILYSTLVQYNLLDKTIVGTFNDNVTKYIDKVYTQKGMIRSASIMEVLKFYFDFSFNVDLTDKLPAFRVLQIPTDDYVIIDFGKEAFIDYAHKYGVAVQYWTINDADEMEALIKMGADTVMTDYPDVANEVYNRVKGK